MSYCRFSSDDWRSDVYVYEHVDGHWRIEIAGSRFDPPPPRVDHSLFELEEPDLEQWAKQHTAQMAHIQTAKRVAIDLEGAGQSLQAENPGEAAEILKQLSARGFRVPDGVIEALAREQAEYDDYGSEK